MKIETKKSEEWKLNVFVKISDKTFHCTECGSNMFSKNILNINKFRCQGCGTTYNGKK